MEFGFSLGRAEVIQNPVKTKQMLIDMVKRSDKEVLLLLPTINAFLREYRMGIFNFLIKSAKNKDIVVKILTPVNNEINKIIANINNNNFKNFIVCPLNANQIKINTMTIVIIDKKESFIIEKVDDKKENFEDAVGLAIYSTSKPTVISYVAIFETLIDQIKLNEQLKISEAFKKEFLSTISHELKTPLVPIRGYTEMLLNPQLLGSLNEMQIRAIQSIFRNVERQESLVDDILNIYSFETRKVNLSKKNVLASEILDNVINDLYPLFMEKNIPVKTDINTKTGDTIYCNEKKIEQVLTNLIKNSLDFITKDTGKITITIEKKENNQPYLNNYNRCCLTSNPKNLLSYHIFTVKDNGPGIPEEKTDLLFKKFNKIDTTASRRYGGTGLGLAICKDIIESHGGKIWIDKNYKNGSCVKFTIPDKIL